MLGFAKPQNPPLDLDEPQQKMVPPDNLTSTDFVVGSQAGLHNSRQLPSSRLAHRVLAMAWLCVEVYRQQKKLERDAKLRNADQDERRTWSEYGLHLIVVSPVVVTPIGSEGTWMVSLRTTHVNGPTHPGLLRTTFIFNENPTDLSKPSKSMLYDWVIAEKMGKYVIVGNREKLGGLSELELENNLKRDGYANVGVISIAEEDRRMGFLVK